MTDKVYEIVQALNIGSSESTPADADPVSVDMDDMTLDELDELYYVLDGAINTVSDEKSVARLSSARERIKTEMTCRYRSGQNGDWFEKHHPQPPKKTIYVVTIKEPDEFGRVEAEGVYWSHDEAKITAERIHSADGSTVKVRSFSVQTNNEDAEAEYELLSCTLCGLIYPTTEEIYDGKWITLRTIYVKGQSAGMIRTNEGYFCGGYEDNGEQYLENYETGERLKVFKEERDENGELALFVVSESIELKHDVARVIEIKDDVLVTNKGAFQIVADQEDTIMDVDTGSLYKISNIVGEVGNIQSFEFELA